MKIIESPPNLENENNENFMKIMNVGRTPALQSLLYKISDKYMYWTEVKHRIPAGIDFSAKEIWAYIKFGREVNRKLSDIRDVKGRYFAYWIPDSLFRSISEIDKWSGSIISSDQPSLPSKEKYIISSLMDEAIASSQLEGAATEYVIAKELLKTGRKPIDKHEKMIVNNWIAMKYIRKNIHNELSVDFILELHSILTQETLPNPSDSGKLRNTDDIDIKYRGEVIHVPSKASELQDRMDSLIRFANNEDGKNWIHPVIKGWMLS